jgi:hypothetical protein
MPKEQNRVVPFLPGGSTDTAYAQRRMEGDDEVKAIREKGYVLTKEGGRKTKYWTAVDNPKTDYPEGKTLIRAPRGDVKENKAVSADSVEIHDKKTGKWSPIKGSSLGGSSGAGSSMSRKELQLGAELDPKAMMKREGYKRGGKVKSASARADGIAIRGRTRA